MTGSTFDERLRKEAVVLEAAEHERTGAQEVAPGHLARPAYRAGELPARAPFPASVEDVRLHCELTQFLSFQAELLDRKLWEAYIDLFDDESVYWMPSRLEQSSWLDEPAIFAEDKYLMRVRMGRLTHPNAWSQAATWMTSHLVSNVVIEGQHEGTWVVRSRFQAVELREQQLRQFAGSYRHVLRPGDGGYRIVHQRVDLMNAYAPFEYVIQAWL